MTQPDQHLEQILQSTLGSGRLPADRKRLHREQLGLLAGPMPTTLPANSRFPSAGTSNEFRTITSTAGSGLRDRLELITIVAVIALVVGGVVFSRMFLDGDGADEPGVAGIELTDEYDVYVRSGGIISSGGTTGAYSFTPIDRETLEDRTDLPQVSGINFISSSGQSTVARIEYPDQMPNPADGDPSDGVRIIILDAETGEERNNFHAPAFVHMAHLSPDGSRVAVQTALTPPGEQLPNWWVLDTSNGRVISTIDDDWSAWREKLLFSPDGDTIYRVLTAQADTTDLMPVQIIAYDVATGDETNQRGFDSIQTGLGQLAGVNESPDGRTLAIAHADTRTVTLINLERLTIEQSFAFSDSSNEPEPWSENTDSTWVQIEAEFSLDGRYLYVFGSSSEEHFGLTAVDLENRRLAARFLDGSSITNIVPAPDGKCVYASRTGESGGPAVTIYRLDSETLEILAERDFPVFGGVIINPIVLPANGPDSLLDGTPQDPLEFIFDYRRALEVDNLDAARGMYVEPFREFSDEVLFDAQLGRPFSWEPDDWTIEQNEQFTVVRLNSRPDYAWVLRQSGSGWLIDPGLEAHWYMQRRENDDFDRFEGRQRIRVDQMSDQNPGDTGMHVGISVNVVELHPDNTMDISIEWRVTNAAAASFPLEGLSWADGNEQGDVEVTRGTVRLTEDSVEFPIPADSLITTFIYSATLTLHDVPDSGELRLHMPWITLTNAAGEERTTSAILHLPVADYPQAE